MSDAALDVRIAQELRVRAMTAVGWTLRRARIAAWIAAFATPVGTSAPLGATPCAFEAQGEGRVAAIIDGKSFRLADGRELRLAGIEPAGASKAERIAVLSAVLADKDVSL